MGVVVRIGRRIAICREYAGLTQSALARAINASQSAVSQIESGDRNPSYAMLHRIAKVCGVRLDVLVKDTQP